MFFGLFSRVTVTGIYRAVPMRVNPRQNNVNSVYKTHIDVIHFRKTDKKRLHERDADGFVISSNFFPFNFINFFPA